MRIFTVLAQDANGVNTRIHVDKANSVPKKCKDGKSHQWDYYGKLSSLHALGPPKTIDRCRKCLTMGLNNRNPSGVWSYNFKELRYDRG